MRMQGEKGTVIGEKSMKNEEYKKLSIKEFTKAAGRYESSYAGIYEMCKKDYPDIQEELEKEPFRDLLDAGCGPAPMISLLAEKYPEAQVVGNVKTFNMIPQFFTFDLEGRKVVVKEGDTLSLGSHTLQFVMAPMVHWPEVMVAYETSEKILFSADGFGKFGALDADEDWACEARRYYFNICGKYGVQVQNLLKKAAGLDIEIICPLHGPILKENLGYYIGLYDTWSKYEPENEGILIAYASIHGNTAAAAKKLAEILEAKGAPKVVVADLSRDDMAEAIEDAFRYDKLVLAAASYDASVFPCMETFLNKLTNKNYQNRKIAIIENGSWAPTAARVMTGMFEKSKT